MKTIAYYITAHGYGHGVRSLEIIRALHRIRPEQRVVIVSRLPEAFLQNRLASHPLALRPRSFDIGMVQLDSIRVDLDATLQQAWDLILNRRALVDQEEAFIRNNDIGLVVADIPAIPLEAAAQAGVPGIAIGNFSWDWIYEAYKERHPRWRTIAGAFAQGYAAADLLLRLPFHAEMNVFRNVLDVPLVGSPGRVRRTEIAGLSGARPDLPWVLLSFTSLDWNQDALDELERIRDYEFFTVLPLEWRRRNIRAIDGAVIPFPDVLASADIVLSKPGYGILAECVANRKPLIFAERTDFAEYAVLEAAARRYLRHVHIPAENLYRGKLRAALESIRESPEAKETLPLGGALMAARRLMKFFV